VSARKAKFTLPTPEEMMALVGRRARWHATPGIQVDVTIRAAIASYGHLLLTIAPVAGTGTTVVRSTSITLEEIMIVTRGRHDGAGGRTRTDDLRFTKPLLCQLSYTGAGDNAITPHGGGEVR
jgi:hypothetical protein